MTIELELHIILVAVLALHISGRPLVSSQEKPCLSLMA